MCRVQDGQRTVVAESGSNALEDAGDCLKVVTEDLRARFEDDVEQVLFAGKILGQHLDADAGSYLVDLTNRLGA